MNKSRFALGLFGIGVAIVFHVDALGYPEQAAQMPLIYSVAVALLSLAMIAQEAFNLRRHNVAQLSEGKTQEIRDEEDDGSPRRRGAVFVIFFMAVAYVMAIGTLGYLLATVAFMLASLAVIRTVSMTFSLIGIAALVAVICLVFIGFLGLPIPLLPTFV